MTAGNATHTGSRFATVGLLAAIGVTGLVLLLPTPERLPPEAHRMAALLIVIGPLVGLF